MAGQPDVSRKLLPRWASAGIPVKLLVDAIGSATLGEPILEILVAGGCQLALIVDGRVAFTGGAGLADHWLGAAGNENGWRDIEICVKGPAVLAQQTGFAQNWLLATGEILSGHDFFPPPQPAGSVGVQTILRSPSPSCGATAAGAMHLIAVQCARRFLYIANPSFVPDSRVIEMLANACRRGVAVKLMVAGRNNDTWWARQNSLRLYGRLLAAGVEIYEFQPTMLHQKTMVVDGVWATAGTANFDVEELRRIFLADLARCSKVELSDWAPVWPVGENQRATCVAYRELGPCEDSAS